MALRSTLLALAGVLALVPGCSRRPGRLADEPAVAYRALEVPGFLPAVLHVPRGEGPHPLIVAAHGAHGFPEDPCEQWVALTEGRAVVLCLRGARTDVTRPSGFYFATHHVLGRELDAALAALRKTDVPLTPGSYVYTGFSQGAIMGAIVLVDRAAEFPRVAFVEGGFQYWSVARARRFAKNGGKRVLVVCGTAWCSSGSRDVVRWLRGAGVEVRLEYAPGAGHTSSGAVYDRTRTALPWLLGVDQGSR